MPNEIKEKRTRRSAGQIEMDAFSALVTLLRPLTPEQRNRLIECALKMMPEELNVKTPETA